jgi:RimJ/RimL family protein N-acetyltransferase
MIKNKVTYLDKKNKSLRLVKFKRKHISKTYLGWLNDKKLKFSENRFSKHNYPSAINYLRENAKNKNLFLAVELLRDKRYLHVGNVLLRIDTRNKRGHLSILIGINKNKGIGYQVWKKMLEIAFKTFNCKLVVAGTMKSNKAMFKIFKKCKMKILVLPGYFFQNRKKDDLIISYKTRKNDVINKQF